MYKRYGRRLFSYALSTWRLNEDDAWEVVYQTLYKVIEKINQYKFESENNFSSFIFKVFINQLRNHIRNQKTKKIRTISTSEEYVFDEIDSSELMNDIDPVSPKPEENQQLLLLKQELDELEEWEKILLLLRSQNMPYNEIAKYVNKPVDQLKVYYQRLKVKILNKINNRIQINDDMKQPLP